MKLVPVFVTVELMPATKNRAASGKLYSGDTFKSSRRVQGIGRLVAGPKNHLLARDWVLYQEGFFLNS